MPPTVPHPDVFPGFAAEPGVEGYLDQCAALVLEAVAFGTHVLHWRLQDGESATTEQEGTAKAIIATHLRWCLELAGGISAKLRKGWIDSIAADLRSLFESWVSLEYMIRADSVRRAYAYQCCFLRRRLRFCESQLPDTRIGKQFAAMQAKDRLLGRVSLASKESESRAEIKRLQDLLASPAFREADSEFERLRRKRGRVPDWFNFYGGQEGLEQLASHLGLGAFYEIFYRDWSERAHGLRVLDSGVATYKDGLFGLKQLHLPLAAPHMLTMTINLLSGIYEASVSDLRSDHRVAYGTWRTGIRPEFTALRKSIFVEPSPP